MTRAGTLYDRPGNEKHAKVVRALSTGMTLYPSGDKDGDWWAVKDELGNSGWVNSMNVQLAK
jgi:hypothetical protein